MSDHKKLQRSLETLRERVRFKDDSRLDNSRLDHSAFSSLSNQTRAKKSSFLQTKFTAPCRMKLQKSMKLEDMGRITNIGFGKANQVVSLSKPNGAGICLVWDCLKGKETDIISFDNQFQSFITLDSFEGRTVLSGGLDNVVSVHKLRSDSEADPCSSSTPMAVLRGHEDCIYNCLFLQPNKTVSVSTDQKVRVWDMESLCSDVLSGHDDSIYCCALDPKSPNLVLTGSSDCTARLWDIRQNSESMAFEMTAAVQGLDISPEGSTFAAALEDGLCALMDLRSQKQLLGLKDAKLDSASIGSKGKPMSAEQVSFSANGRLLFARYSKGQVLVYDIAGKSADDDFDFFASPFLTSKAKKLSMRKGEKSKCMAFDKRTSLLAVSIFKESNPDSEAKVYKLK